ncbi:MAG: RNA methyltransferase [Deltaproteobacteria bacterium]|nr:RNA methyltransferase [Deltaproteobacteria bacterium]MBW1955058.1 RNA methyltransferase [Deltaproteobacteria bacterium]MBW2133182.1 RNA methyltransferase [Deltaproteobacteria bacterium]
MPDKVNLEHVGIILHRPRLPENIGAAARAMQNMGIRRLGVVDPQDCDLTRILKLATHSAVEIIEEMEVFETLEDALGPYGYVAGTTARTGGTRYDVFSPSRMAQTLIPISRENRIAVVFGPEDRGLTNAELRLCHLLVTIPTARFSSLNLAQAVMIICYELHRAAAPEPPAPPGRLATRHELDGMYDQVKDLLVRINYINPENPDYWMGKIRRFFTRMQLKAGEVSIIRGICRQVYWYSRKCYLDGTRHKEKQRCG